MSKNLPSLVQLAKIGKHRESYQKSVLHANQMSDMYYNSNNNPISVQNQNIKNPMESIDTRDVKQVGKSMFININGNDDEPNNMVAQPQNNLKLTQDLKGKIDECLKLAQEKPGVRKQILG